MEIIWMNTALCLTLVLTRCFVVYHAQACGTTDYLDSAGNVSSPRFPSLYDHGLNCSYNLKSSGQTSLTILFHTVDLEVATNCKFDWVEICCVDNYENIQKFCRLRETRSVFYASCNHSIITFRTDGSGTRRGFQLSYTFQRVSSASATRRIPKTTTMRTRPTFSPTTEATSASKIVTEDPDILSYIATALGPNVSALLILVLVGLLGLSLLSVVALLIILQCRSRKSKADKGKKTHRQKLAGQSTEHYTLDRTEERGDRKNETGRFDNVRESCISENDYERPNDVDYEIADEINTVTRGRR